MTTPHLERFCEHCVTVKPLSDFRRRFRDGTARLNQCRSCHSQAERQRRARHRARQGHRNTSKQLTQLKSARSDAQLKLLTSAMFQYFGGLEGFVAAWHQFQARAIQQGGPAALKTFQAMFRLIQFCDSQRAAVSAPAPSYVTDEDLERELREQTRQLIRREPELAVAAAAELGWTVIPQTQASAAGTD